MKKETRGGSRENSGREKLGNVQYQRRIKPRFVPLMDLYLKELKQKPV